MRSRLSKVSAIIALCHAGYRVHTECEDAFSSQNPPFVNEEVERRPAAPRRAASGAADCSCCLLPVGSDLCQVSA